MRGTIASRIVPSDIAAGSRAPREALIRVIALLIAYQLGLMLLIHVKARFLLPMIPILCGFAGSFLVAVRNHLAVAAAMRSETKERSLAAAAAPTVAFTPVRLAAGTALAALLLFLAFAGPVLDRLCAG
jgi:hypothetical protein